MIFQSKQDHLLFSLSRLQVDECREEIFCANLRQANPTEGYAQLVELAIRNGTAGFLYNNIKKAALFPEQKKQQLQDVYRKTTYRNLHQLAETVKVLQILAANRIRVIPLKGVVASEIIFHDLGVYPSGDIDVLVHPDDLDAAVGVLQNQAGYSPVSAHRQEELLAGHYHYMLHNDQYLLEVHWNLTRRYFRMEADFWWQGVQAVEWRGMEILELAPEKYLMYAIFRLFDHCFYPLRFLVLIAGIVEQYAGEICWKTFMQECEQYRMKRLAVFTLQLTHDILGTALPADAADTNIIGYSALKKLCLSGMLKGVERKHFRMMCYMSLLDTPGAISQALLGRLAPGREELCLRYHLASDSPRVFLYYLLNPVLLFMKDRGEL